MKNIVKFMNNSCFFLFRGPAVHFIVELSCPLYLSIIPHYIWHFINPKKSPSNAASKEKTTLISLNVRIPPLMHHDAPKSILK